MGNPNTVADSPSQPFVRDCGARCAHSSHSRATLRRSCLVLLRAFPAEYRNRRGAEIMATVLDVTPPGRRLPVLADAADVVAHGLRQRLRTATIAGLDGGLLIAAPFALALAAGIAALAWWRVEPIGDHGNAVFGYWRTLGPIAYVWWMLAAASHGLAGRRLSRLFTALAVCLTVALPVISPMVGADRPPLWILMSLTAFGVLSLAGSSPAAGAASSPSVDERLAVPAGALAVAVGAATAIDLWPPPDGVDGYYYQPTVARVGVVAALVIAVMAGTAVLRQLRGQPSAEWLWATVLLGLPAGWLGPFDTSRLRLAADLPVPHFGRLAQVVLATCVAGAAMARAWRASTAAPARADRALRRSGVTAIGCAAGLAALVALARAGVPGFDRASAAALPQALPGHVLATFVMVLVAGVCAVVASAGCGVPYAVLVRRTGAAGTVFAAAGWLVAAYDNGWTATGWPDGAHTLSLVSTLALLPLSHCAIAATRALHDGRSRMARLGATVCLSLCLGWLAYLTVPYILSWGPVLLVLLACGVVVFRPRNRPTFG